VIAGDYPILSSLYSDPELARTCRTSRCMASSQVPGGAPAGANYTQASDIIQSTCTSAAPEGQAPRTRWTPPPMSSTRPLRRRKA